MKFHAVIVLCLLLLFSASPSYSSGVVKITMQEEVQASGADILLGDVAHISGGDKIKRNQAAKIFISKAPGAGQYVVLTQESLNAKLTRAGFSKGDTEISGAKMMKIHSQALLLSRKELVAEARKYLEQSKIWKEELKFADSTLIAPQPLPSGKVKFTCNIINNAPAGKVKVEIETSVAGKLERKDIVTFTDTEAFRPKGRSNGSGSSVSNLKPVIKKGDPVEIVFIRKNLTITSQGQAAEPAAIGENLRVTAQGGKKTYNAVLQDEKTAVVEI